MLSSFHRQRSWWLLLFAALICLEALATGFGSASADTPGPSVATPFESPLPENVIHAPLVTQGSGEAVSLPLPGRSDGVPILWLALVFLFLVGMTVAVAIRRRPRRR